MGSMALSAVALMLGAAQMSAEPPVAPAPRLLPARATKVFCVTDLIAGQPTGSPAADAARTEANAARLVKLITVMVRPNSWDGPGRGTAVFFPIGSALVVNNTPDVLKEVADLLETLRWLSVARGGAGIRCATPRYQCGPLTTIDDVLHPQVMVRVVMVKVPHGFAAECGLEVGSAPGVTVVLSPRELHMLMTILQNDRDRTVLGCPRVTTLDGQTATVQLGVSVPMPGDVRPAGGVFGPNPEPTVVAGLSLTVTPKLSEDGSAAVLWVSAEHTELKAVLGAFVGSGPAVLTPVMHLVPRPVFAVRGANGKCVVPLGYTAVFRLPEGGKSFTGALGRVCGGKFETLLIVTPTTMK